MSKDNFFEGFENHTLAKLELYRRYLSVYFRIMLNSGKFQKINVYDYFCGQGLTDDGQKGSPLVAIYEASRYAKNKNPKIVNFYFNDEVEENIAHLRKQVNFLDLNNTHNTINVDFDVNDGFSKLNSLSNSLKRKPIHKDHLEHNLIFIDPFGYKGIQKQTLFDLMSCPYTEVILFMPVSHIYRFIKREIKEEGSMNTPALTSFINSFFSDVEKREIEKGKIDGLIKTIRDVLRNKSFYYVSVLKIKTLNKANSNALFFMTKNLKGLEKMLDAQWKIAKKDGYEVTNINNSITIGLFDQYDLEEMVKEYLQEYRTNVELYEYILANDRLPTQAKDVLKNFESKNLLLFTDDGERNNKGLYLNYKAYSKEPPKYKVRWRNPQ